MEQKLQEKLLDALFEQGIEYHSRHRIRKWCDCSFCQEKRRGTAEISFGSTRWLWGNPWVPGYRKYQTCCCTDGCPQGCLLTISNDLPPCDNYDDAIRNRLERIREGLRRKLRMSLHELKTAHKGVVEWKPSTLKQKWRVCP